MLDVIVTFDGLDAVETGLERMESRADDVQRTVIQQLGDDYLAILQDETPVGRGERPGVLKRGYQTQQQYNQTGTEYQITNTVPHLRFVLNGRGAVTAQSAQALRFVIDGRVFFRRSVGSAAANPFDERAKQRIQPAINQAGPRIANLLIKAYEGVTT